MDGYLLVDPQSEMSSHMANSILPLLRQQKPDYPITALDSAGDQGAQLVQKFQVTELPFLCFPKVGVAQAVGHPTALLPTLEKAAQLFERLQQLVKSSRVMVFMKGTKEEPFCKFSKRLVALFAQHKLQYSSFNIFTDESVRSGLKFLSDWPTYPQVYVDGELLGGIDIITELDEAGELLAEIPEACGGTKANGGQSNGTDDPLKARCLALINREPIMLFMKGTPDAPYCGFSSHMVELLRAENVKFGSFDILEDSEVRQKLKELSEWPTYPQLYVRGQLLGGVDVVKELVEDGALADEIAQAMQK